MLFKQTVHNYFLQLLQTKIKEIEQVLADLHYSAANETKSTAGDKHETALAMLQIEQANKRQQLNHLLEQKVFMESINSTVTNKTINKGSLVQTKKGFFYLSVALGKATINDKQVIALSLQSPLGIKFMGLKVGDTLVFNSAEYVIESIE